MGWNDPIDAYCERVGPAFWAEPLNAVSNLAFIVAALTALGIARRAGRLDGPVFALAAVVAIIGVGSFFFHTFATRWAGLADVLPILVFILGYFAAAMNRFAGFGWGRALLLAGGFALAMLGLSSVLAATPARVIGAGLGYLPALLAMIGVGLLLQTREHPAGRWLVGAAAVFAVSLILRMLDRPLCADWPNGTHFLWHLLNALVLGTLVVALARHGRPPERLDGRARIA